ncbi:MAG TPA: amidohydrolase [Firmicutes bacterium]|nr:amidohydrolase [Bacillota bacterium]
MFAIINAKIHTITNGVIENGAVLIKKGKIEAVGENISIPEGTQVIDAKGKVVTPGLIDCHSHLGVFGEPLIWANSDGNEFSDPVTPQVRGIDSLNPQDISIPDVVAGGVTTVYSGPGSANVIGGTGFAMKLRGKTVDEMVIPGTEAMKMALGENPKRCYGQDKKVMPYTRMGSAAVLRNALTQARNYIKKAEREGDKLEVDLKMEALARVVKREIKARIHSHRADDILTAVRVAEEFNLDFIIEHATEGHLIADVLAKKGVRCTIGPTLLGKLKMEVANITLKNPGILARSGVKIALQCDDFGNTKWLPLHAGIAVREGMPEDEAFRAVTITPAEFIGISDRLGSIEQGKDADLVIWSGHPFNSMTATEKVFIEGNLAYERKDPVVELKCL